MLGSGRAELARALMGIVPASSGVLCIDGHPVTIGNVADALQHRIALVPEDRLSEGLFIDNSIGFNMMCRVLHEFESELKLLDWAALKQKAQQWVDALKVKTNDCRLPVSSLSGGNQQKVVLAKWLAFNPRILILVGPTVGVDIRAKMEIIDKIHQLAEQGLSVIVITDDIPELLQVSNAVMVMTRGRSSRWYRLMKWMSNGSFDSWLLREKRHESIFKITRVHYFVCHRVVWRDRCGDQP